MEPDTGVECMGTWEARAAELFKVCDRECKGFITKRDLQHLWGELPLDPDELESVFDSLDKDQNGFLSLQEFTNGFGSHLGLVIEFRADSSSSGSEGEQLLEAGEVGGNEGGGTEDCQLDGILSLLASQDLDSNSAVVEAVWRQIGDSGASMERLVAALLQELSRVKLEQGHLEAALATKTEQFNQQVSRLYEELEAQISGEQAKAAKEHSQRGARVLATLEEEVAERDAALRALEEEQQGLRQRLEQAAAGEVAARQDNLRLEQHLKRLEEDLMRREAEVEELMQALDIHRRNSKNEKRRRAQHAFKVTEGIARERESLVTQLDLLRTINTQLRDEQDQIMPWSLRSRERTDPTAGVEEDYCSQSPPSDLRGIACTSPPPRPPISLPLLPTASSLHGSGGTASDCEHDDDYFSDTKVEVQQDSPSPSSPGEVSILQEILSQPALCVECGGALPSRPAEHAARPLLLRRQESFTQTSPTAETSPRSIETLVNTPDNSADKEAPQMRFANGICDPDRPRLCICNGRVKATTPSPPQWYSSSLVIFQPHHNSTHMKKHHHTTTHLQIVHHTLHTHLTRHTYHTSFTYFLPDISATTTRHTRSTQSIDQHTTTPQQDTAPQRHAALQQSSIQHQSTTPRHDIEQHHHHHTTSEMPITSPSVRHTTQHHPTTPKRPTESHHSATRHHRTSHDSTTSLRIHKTVLYNRGVRRDSDAQEKHSDKQHNSDMEQHSNVDLYHDAPEQHKEQDNTHAEQYMDTHDQCTTPQYSDTKHHNKTQQHNTQEQCSSSSQQSKAKQHNEIREDDNTQEHGYSSSQRSSTEQHNDKTKQHTDTQLHTSSVQQSTIQEHRDKGQRINTKQHGETQQNNNTQEPATQEQSDKEEHETSYSQPPHISNTQQASLTPNQGSSIPIDTTKQITDTSGNQAGEGDPEESSETLDAAQGTLQEDPQPETITTPPSSRQGKVTDPSVSVTSLLDTRRSTVRRNTPTLVVTPLRHHFPLDAAQHEENHMRAGGNHQEERETEEAKNDSGGAEAPVPCPSISNVDSLLYCPTRMFKVVFIGDSGVGKTTFIHRASTGEYRRDFGSTVGVDYRTVEVRVQGVVAVLQLWDTAGQERFRSITRQYYRNSDCVVVMYDLTNEQTFLNVVDWISSIREAGSEGVMVALVGNKEELEDQRKVDLNEANKLAKTHSCYVCECSAARGSSVQEVLTDLTSLLLSGNCLQGPRPPVILLNQPPRASKTCCKS